MSDAPLPAIRPLDVFPMTNEDGSQSLVVQDNSGIAPEPLALSPAGYFVLANLDGQRSLTDIQNIFQEQYGARLDAEQIMSLIDVLDEALMLDNDRSAAVYQEHVDAYMSADMRDNCSRWASRDEVQAELSELVSALQPMDQQGVLGIVAPHLDYERGKVCYQAAYEMLLSMGPADRYVILGTNHFGRAEGSVATRRDFLTPLGRVATDSAFLAALDDKLAFDLFEHEYDHLREHSIELQVHLLQMMFPEHRFSIVPILCPDPSMLEYFGREADELDHLATALRDVIGMSQGRTLVIAGADLSHIGQRFGEQEPTDAEFLAQVEGLDRAYLEGLVKREEQEATNAVRLAENATRICSLGCIYTLARTLPEARCQLLEYDQAVDFEQETHVTSAALVYRSH